MLTQTLNLATARGGAAFPGACSPWATVSGVRANHVRTQNPVQAAGMPGTRRVAFRRVPAMAAQLALMGSTLPTAIETRKPNVHKTRISVGGYGAMGPHPEREPA